MMRLGRSYHRSLLTFTIGLSILLGTSCQKSVHIEPVSKPAPPPLGLSVNVVGPGNVVVTWNLETLNRKLLLERKKAGDLFYQIKVNPIRLPVGTFHDTNLEPLTQYLYRIRDPAGTDFKAIIATIKTTIQFPPPNNIEAVFDTTNHSVLLTWNDPTGWADKWLVQRGIGGDWTTIGRVTENHFIDNPSLKKTTVQYRLQSLAGNNYQSPLSDSVKVYIPGPKNIKRMPPPDEEEKLTILPVTLIADRQEDGSINLSLDWKGQTSGQFIIERKEIASDGSGLGFFNPIDTISAGTREFQDRHPPENSKLLYRVRQVGTDELGDISPSLLIKEVIKPTSPQGLTANPVSDRSIRLEWKVSDWAKGYRIDRRDHFLYKPIVELPSDSTSFIDTTCEMGVQYTYRIQSWSEDKESPYSYSQSVHTIFPPPDSVTVRALSDKRVEIGWKYRMDFEDGFIIEREDPTGWVQIDSVRKGMMTAVDSNLTGQARTRYRIYAYRGENHSKYVKSEPVLLELRPPKHLNLKTISFFESEIDWEGGSGLETGYRIERRTLPSKEFKTMASVQKETKVFHDTTLSPGSNVQYRIIALGEIHSSPPSAVLSLEIPNPLKEMRRITSYTSYVLKGGILKTLPPWLVFKTKKDSTITFSILDHEVTNNEYLFFCKSTGRNKPATPNITSVGNNLREYPKSPVVNVSWYDAADYANWLSTMLHLQPAYDDDYNLIDKADGFRLPFAIEYLITSHIDPPLSISADQDSVGIFDFLGNVREWCTDPCNECTNRSLSPSGGLFREVRGPGWCDPQGLEPLDACWAYPGRSTYPTVGFRLVRPIEGSQDFSDWPKPNCTTSGPESDQITLGNNR